MTSNELETISAHVEAMRRAYAEIESARTIDEVKDIRDRAEAARQYARAAGYSRDITNMCAEIKLRAERKAGALLADMPKNPGYRNPGTNNVKAPAPPKLEEIGVSHIQSHRWQQTASVPDDVFEDYIEAVRKDDSGTHDLITTSGLRLHAARQRKPDPVAEPVPLPDGKFACIVADPPWSMRLIEREQRPDQGRHVAYPTMEVDEIAKLPVGELAADDAHLYLWVTHRFLPAGLDLVEQWGFAYQCLMTWRKNVGFTPFSWMYDTEHVIFARRGNLTMAQLGLRLSFDAPVNGHSVKPDVFYERVVAASPGPRLEMFARRERDGFTAWGNEV
jgi:N6-adenosine-specific RNA methylase IME4